MQKILFIIALALPIAFSCTKTEKYIPPVDIRIACCGTYYVSDSFLLQFSRSTPPVNNQEEVVVTQDKVEVAKDTIDPTQLNITLNFNGGGSIFYHASQLTPYNNGIAFHMNALLYTTSYPYYNSILSESDSLLYLNKVPFSGYIIPDGSGKSLKINMLGTQTIPQSPKIFVIPFWRRLTGNS